MESGSTSRDPSSRKLRRSRWWLWPGIGLLAVLHHDFWFWDDAGLVLGFMPLGMAYHIVYSMVASLFWLIVLRGAWPDELEDWSGRRPTNGGRRIR